MVSEEATVSGDCIQHGMFTMLRMGRRWFSVIGGSQAPQHDAHQGPLYPSIGGNFRLSAWDQSVGETKGLIDQHQEHCSIGDGGGGLGSKSSVC